MPNQLRWRHTDAPFQVATAAAVPTSPAQRAKFSFTHLRMSSACCSTEPIDLPDWAPTTSMAAAAAGGQACGCER